MQKIIKTITLNVAQKKVRKIENDNKLLTF